MHFGSTGEALAQVGIIVHVNMLQVFKRFKELADVKKGITDDDIVALASDETNQPDVIWELADLQARCRPKTLNPACAHCRGRNAFCAESEVPFSTTNTRSGAREPSAGRCAVGLVRFACLVEHHLQGRLLLWHSRLQPCMPSSSSPGS